MAFDPDAQEMAGAALAGLNVVRASKRLIRLDILPQNASGQSGYNGVSYTQSGTATRGNEIYALAYNSDGDLMISKKTLPKKTWAMFNLRLISGNPLILPVGNDSHNSFSMALDGEGYIHICANMHGGSLRYVRSVNPYDISAWIAPGMIGPWPVTDTLEQQVTYPRFNRFSDGSLLFFFRDGTSGNGDCYVNYKAARQLGWVRRPMLAAGKVNNENPYESHVVIDHRDWIWIVFTWRPNGGDANANNDLHLVVSKDKGVTWQAIDGSAVELPLVHGNTNAKIMSTTSTNAGIINQFGLAVSPVTGRPHIALSLADPRADGSGIVDCNIHHLRFSDQLVLINDQVTDLQNGFGLLTRATRPYICCSAEGRVLIAYSAKRVNTADSFRMMDVTPNADGSSAIPADFIICNTPGGDFEITAADDALRDQNIFRALVSTCNADVLTPGPEYYDLSLWSKQWIGVLSIDLSRIGDLASGRERVPEIRTIVSAVMPPATAVASSGGASSAVAAAGQPAVVTAPALRYRKLFARVSMRAKVAGGTLNAVISEQQNGGIADTALLPFTNVGTDATKGTPWVPLTSAPDNGLDTTVSLRLRMSTGQTGTINGATVELAMLDGPVVMP